MAIIIRQIEHIGPGRKGQPIIVFLLALGLFVCLSACGRDNTVLETAQPSSGEVQVVDSSSSESEGEASEPIGDEQIQILWRESAHAATYVLDDAEQNSTCARCHAPVNWLPSMDDIPESCLACKFEVDSPPPVIFENEWTHIECKVCHKYKKDELQPEVVWLEIAAIDEYIDVESTTALCDKCHLAVDIPSHSSVIVAGDHSGYDCVECHDPHSAQSSCGSEGCHPVLMDGSDGIAGHDEDHSMVTCSACHDASGMDIGPDDDAGVWVTFLFDSEFVQTSHETQREVDCARCHYATNPWGLSEEAIP